MRRALGPRFFGWAGLVISALASSVLVTVAPVTASAAEPTVAITPNNGPKGTSVHVAGANFSVGEIVKVKYKTGLSSPTTQLVCQTTVQSDSSFACDGAIPTTKVGAFGSHGIVAKGKTSFLKAKTTFTLYGTEIFAVGDSITYTPSPPAPDPTGYGPPLLTKVANAGIGHAWFRAYPSGPCDGWADWVTEDWHSHLDYVVFEDYYPSNPSCQDVDEYRASFQAAVDAANAKGAYVIILDGDHPDLSSLTGVDILDYPVPPPDAADGIHYTDGGYKSYAANVVQLLDYLIP
jgi:hypothetical protein